MELCVLRPYIPRSLDICGPVRVVPLRASGRRRSETNVGGCAQCGGGRARAGAAGAV